MSDRYLTLATLRRDASARAMIRVLAPADPNRALDTQHQLVWSLFAKEGREEADRDFLWRSDDERILILSAEPPDDHHALFDLQVRRFNPTLPVGERFGFRLRVNATVCRTENVDGERIQHRHDVVMDTLRRFEAKGSRSSRAVAREEAIPLAAREWLERTGSDGGFKLGDTGPISYRTLELGRRRKRHARFGVLDIDGVLEVTDPRALRAAIVRGFGRAKAFGCGLMLLRQ